VYSIFSVTELNLKTEAVIFELQNATDRVKNIVVTDMLPLEMLFLWFQCLASQVVNYCLLSTDMVNGAKLYATLCRSHEMLP